MNIKDFSQYKNQQVLVTGGDGFIGSHLVEALLKNGAKVTVLDICNTRSKKKSNVTYIHKDILDQDLFTESNRFEYIFHLAARCDLDGKSLTDYAVNFKGTKNLLSQLDAKTIKRFVFYSTQLVVGLFDEARFIDHKEPYKTNTIYGESKILGEKVVRSFCKKNAIPFSIIRPTSVYGPRGREPYRNYFLAIKKRQYIHVGKASNFVSMTYVENVVSLTLLVGLHPKAIGNIYYGTDYYPYSMRQMSNEVSTFFGYVLPTVPSFLVWIAAYGLGIFKHFGVPVPLYPFRLKNIVCTYCYDMSNAAELGYKPKFSLKKGILKTLSWYVKNDSEFKTI